METSTSTSGLVLSLAIAALLARSISAFLYGVQPLNPATFGLVAVVVALAGVIATAAPRCVP
jgi:hypothetical protein